MKVYTGKRGQAFEQMLDFTNRIYENRGIALINKRPTPVKVLKTKGVRVISAFYDKKSTVDYDGVYKGRAIAFEAKSTKKKNLPLDMIPDHQVKYLNQAEKHGAISFLIVEMKSFRDVFIIPSNMLRKYIKNAKNGGRKSIPIDEMEVYARLVESKNGVPLDYLSVVDKLIGSKIA